MRLQAISNRPLVLAFLRGLERGQPGLCFEVRPLTVGEAAAAPPSDDVEAVLVDVSLDAASATAYCERTRRRSPHIPVLGFVCCSCSISPVLLRHLLSIGVAGVVDFRITPEELLTALRGLTRGASVLNLTDQRRHPWLWKSAFDAGHDGLAVLSSADSRLLELVTSGLPDRVIARRLLISPHTVRHRVDRLRGRIGARNRIELAAWAGSRGLYATAEDAVL